ncbi:MAG: hypothetical protein QM758_17560 [Armatimonas sp.]
MLRQRFQEEEGTVRRSTFVEPETMEAESASDTVETLDTLVWENPLLAKELRAGKRRTWSSARAQLAANARRALTFGAISGGLLLTMLYTKLFPSLAPDEISMTWRILLGIVVGIQGTLLVAGAGGINGNIMRERSKQTWSALLLTRLTPKQLVLGKLIGSMAPGAMGALGLMPLLLWCLANAGPAGWLWTPLAWLVMGVAAPLTGLLALRPALQGSKLTGAKLNAAGGLWLGGPLFVQVLYTIGGIFALLLSRLGPIPEGLGQVALILGAVLAVPLLLTSPLIALILALPWLWPDSDSSTWGLVIRLVAIAAHLVFTSVLLRRTWQMTIKEAPRSAPDLG